LWLAPASEGSAPGRKARGWLGGCRTNLHAGFVTNHNNEVVLSRPIIVLGAAHRDRGLGQAVVESCRTDKRGELRVGDQEEIHVRRCNLDPASGQEPFGGIAPSGELLEAVTAGRSRRVSRMMR
jgi:hypothetical protein